MRKKGIVAAIGIVTNGAGDVLIQQRQAGQSYAGYWEFPGGKVERVETPKQAVVRELAEEVGILHAEPVLWLIRRVHYGNIGAELHFFRIINWHGEMTGREGQKCVWHNPQIELPDNMLPVNKIIWKWLSLPRLCAVTAAEVFGVDAFLARAEKCLPSMEGALVQLRDKNLPPPDRHRLAIALRRLTQDNHALLVINDDDEMAKAVNADGVHLSSHHLMRRQERPPFLWVGASCHTAKQLQKAASLNADYAVLSPVHKTLTHVDAPPLGWKAFADRSCRSGIPVYALGGMEKSDLPLAIRHGAHGIGMMRQAWAV